MQEVIVTDEKIKKQVFFYLNNYWNNNYTSYVFPLRNFSLIKREFIECINDNYVFFKRDINSKRAVLILYNDDKNQSGMYLVYKDNTVSKVTLDIEIPSFLFHGGIFDVDVLDNVITIYDTYVYMGVKCNKENYLTRHNNGSIFAHNCLHKIKSCDIYNNLDTIKLDKDLEELYFIHQGEKYTTGVCERSFKWLYPFNIKFNLQCKIYDDFISLYTTNFRNYEIFANIKKGELYDNIMEMNITSGDIISFNPHMNMIKKNESVDVPTSIKNIEEILRFESECILMCDFL